MGEGGDRALQHPAAGCSVELSKYGIIRIGPGIKFWCARLPGVGEVRPPTCPGCGASAISGGRICLQGHGTVMRWVRGVVREGEPPRDMDIVLRRYRCRSCGAVIRVGPPGVLAHRRYSAPTILFALALWCIGGLPPEVVRKRVSPDTRVGTTSSGQRWTTLVRWARAMTGRARPGGLRDCTTLALRAAAHVLGGLGLGAPKPALLLWVGHHAHEGLLRAHEA